MKVQIEVTDQMIEDQFVTAIEGGINYWAYFPKSVAKRLKNDFPEILSFSERVYHAVMVKGYSIPVRDVETGELWNLTKQGVEKGLQIMANDYDNHFSDIVEETGDAITADVFFQLAVIGELTFG